MTPASQSFNIRSATQAELDKALLAACGKSTPAADIGELLKAGANPNAVDSNQADCLTLAVLLKNDDAVKLLLQYGADPHYTGFKNGKTALMWAAHMGQRENVITLLEAGADPELKSGHGKHAMDWADDNNKTHVRDMIRDFIHDKKIAAERAAQEAAAKAEADAFQAVLARGIPLDHSVKPLKTIRLKTAEKSRR